jgi:AmmeMemoRadiSam system protein B
LLFAIVFPTIRSRIHAGFKDDTGHTPAMQDAGDDMRTRMPVVAGQFYPAERDECLDQIRECLASRPLPASLPQAVTGGLVPHAGWTFSGDLAAMVFAAVKQRHQTVGTFVVFGAAHSFFGSLPAVDDNDAWETPLGPIQVDADLRTTLLKAGVVAPDASADRYEHSIEVQIPFILHLFPESKIVPVVVPPVEAAVALGEKAADLASLKSANLESEPPASRPVVFIGSTDLTHYGPRYGFTPMGRGSEGLQWAASVNDRQFIDLATALEPERLLAGAIERGNACGPGAAAAALAAGRRLGSTQALLLAYTNSNEVMENKMGMAGRDSVGYAAIVF